MEKTAAMTINERRNIDFIDEVSAAVRSEREIDRALAEKLALVASTGPLWYCGTFEGRDTAKIASGEIPLLEQIRSAEHTLRPKAIGLLRVSVFYSEDRWPQNQRLAERLCLNYRPSGSFRDWVGRNS